MGCTLLELQAETDIGKGTIHNILTEYLHLHKIASKWIPNALTEVEKWTRYAVGYVIYYAFRILKSLYLTSGINIK